MAGKDSFVCVYIYIYTHIHMYMYVPICTYAYIDICLYVYMYELGIRHCSAVIGNLRPDNVFVITYRGPWRRPFGGPIRAQRNQQS